MYVASENQMQYRSAYPESSNHAAPGVGQCCPWTSDLTTALSVRKEKDCVLQSFVYGQGTWKDAQETDDAMCLDGGRDTPDQNLGRSSAVNHRPLERLKLPMFCYGRGS